MVRDLLLQTQLDRCELIKASAPGKMAQVKQLWPWPDYLVPVLATVVLVAQRLIVLSHLVSRLID